MFSKLLGAMNFSNSCWSWPVPDGSYVLRVSFYTISRNYVTKVNQSDVKEITLPGI